MRNRRMIQLVVWVVVAGMVLAVGASLIGVFS